MGRVEGCDVLSLVGRTSYPDVTSCRIRQCVPTNVLLLAFTDILAEATPGKGVDFAKNDRDGKCVAELALKP